MIETREELFAMPMHEWRFVPIMANHHKWWLKMYRFGDNAKYYFCFVSPKGRRYSYWTGRGKDGRVRLTNADVALANYDFIASYQALWDDKAKLDAVMRLTPKHILDRLFMLLDALG